MARLRTAREGTDFIEVRVPTEFVSAVLTTAVETAASPTSRPPKATDCASSDREYRRT
ncbi:MAG: hypothetical protein V5A56_12685 [Halolamina sp.]